MNESPPDESLAVGRLLVATPVINDPNFERTVVLMLQYDDTDGALGLVINRPTAASVANVLPEWSELVGPPTVVFAGGPVSVESALALGGASGAASEPPGWTPVVHDIGTIDLNRSVEELAPHLSTARIYSGFAGWAPGQLEDEIGVGAWFVVDALVDDALTSEPDELWPKVMRRQPGTRSWLANYPLNPAFN